MDTDQSDDYGSNDDSGSSDDEPLVPRRVAVAIDASDEFPQLLERGYPKEIEQWFTDHEEEVETMKVDRGPNNRDTTTHFQRFSTHSYDTILENDSNKPDIQIKEVKVLTAHGMALQLTQFMKHVRIEAILTRLHAPRDKKKPKWSVPDVGRLIVSLYHALEAEDKEKAKKTLVKFDKVQNTKGQTYRNAIWKMRRDNLTAIVYELSVAGIIESSEDDKIRDRIRHLISRELPNKLMAYLTVREPGSHTPTTEQIRKVCKGYGYANLDNDFPLFWRAAEDFDDDWWLD
jgi:hypothetical protein